jgi:hypothetical protein
VRRGGWLGLDWIGLRPRVMVVVTHATVLSFPPLDLLGGPRCASSSASPLSDGRVGITCGVGGLRRGKKRWGK